uniref:Pentraxin family member n=1 Tax=Saccoglossus kowalevskii TaxID=10224 RepID=A0ABM0MVL0_SACKO|nr:PREDICTED: neuronal pentraxin-2-like [Saccoglossus kowalevskii]
MSEIDYQTTADQVTITAPPPPCDKVEVDENSRVDVMVAIPTMVAVSACIWMKTDEVSGGTAISYNIQGGDNEFLLDVPQSLTLSVRGLISGPTGVSVNDGIWHHVCVVWNSVDGMWRMYDNGVAVADGINFRTGLTIRSGGVMILGQEQDTVGGGFNPAQAWKGELAYFNMWDRVLDDAEILHSAQDCYCQIEGNVFSWKSDSLDVTGSATLSPADICTIADFVGITVKYFPEIITSRDSEAFVN